MKVEPSLIQVQRLDKTFQVNVTINDLWEGWRAVGVQFRLLYNDTLLEIVNVTEGPFLESFACTGWRHDIPQQHRLVEPTMA
jgi:hypothetical protein